MELEQLRGAEVMVAKYTEQMDRLLRRDFKYGTHVAFTIEEYEQLQKENEELKAQHLAAVQAAQSALQDKVREVEELKAAVNALRSAIINSEEGGFWVGGDWIMSEKASDELDEVVRKTPAQHLNDVRADTVEEFMRNFRVRGGSITCFAIKYIQQLREQEK